jgi:hypothetical protein
MKRHSSDDGSVIEDVSILDAPRHPGVAMLSAYWDRKRAGRPMPDRCDIAPSEIVRLLPNIFICETLEGGRDFRFRIFGTALVNLLGIEMTGRTMSELGADPSIILNVEAARHRWRSLTELTYRSASPHFASGYMINTIHRAIAWHSYSAPLTLGESGVAQIVGGLFFDETR